MVQKIIVKLSKEDRKANHVPDWVFDMCQDNDVFIADFKTGKLIQILDFTPLPRGYKIKRTASR